MTKQILLVGGGGHCRACIDAVESAGFTIAGIIDKEMASATVLSYPIIGNDEKLDEFSKRDYLFLITIGQIKEPLPRIRLFNRIRENNGRLATVLASTSTVSRHSTVGEGTIVMHHAIVNAAARIGINCIINNHALIEHDSTIGDHSHISTGAIINGGCNIGQGVFVGSNAVVANGIYIADRVVIGAGSVVIKDIYQSGVYAGNPAIKVTNE